MNIIISGHCGGVTIYFENTEMSHRLDLNSTRVKELSEAMRFCDNTDQVKQIKWNFPLKEIPRTS